MAADFVGLTVLVTLKSPNGARVQGLVADVVGQQLTLRDGKSVMGRLESITMLTCVCSNLACFWTSNTELCCGGV